MKLTSGLVLKIVLALAPTIAGSVATYYLSKDKAAGGYTTLSGSVNELQGAVEQLRLQVQHIQDLHFISHPASFPASAPADVCAVTEPVTVPVINTDDLLDAINSAKAAYSMKPVKTLHLKSFKRVPLRLDDAKMR